MNYNYEMIKCFIKQNLEFKNDNQRLHLNKKLKKADSTDLTTQLCYKLFNTFMNNGNIVEKNNDDEIIKLRRENGHLKSINAKYKIELQNYKNDMKSLSTDYFALLDRKDNLERENENLNIKVDNLNKKLKPTKNTSPAISPPNKPIYPPVNIELDEDPDKDYQHPVENTQDYKDIKLQMAPLENIIKEKTKQKNDLCNEINNEMEKEDFNLKKITDVIEPQIKILEDEIKNVENKLKTYRHNIKELINF